jgi:membrane protein implicated in regulation of membrane protease activity
LFKIFMLFIGLLAYLIITPVLTNTSFQTVDFIIISVMTIVFSIPYAEPFCQYKKSISLRCTPSS